MRVLSVTGKGQVTLKRDVLRHLSVQPGEKVSVEKLPDGRIALEAARPAGKISDVFGILKREGAPSLSIEEIGALAAGAGPATGECLSGKAALAASRAKARSAPGRDFPARRCSLPSRHSAPMLGKITQADSTARLSEQRLSITADTNVLVRAITEDDAPQSKIARTTLGKAESVAVTLPALWELVWVLAQGYRISAPEISAAVRRLVNADNVAVDRPAVVAGLALLDSGRDFADGVIAYAGRWLGAEAFVSFEKEAVRLLEQQGQAARLLG